MRVAVEKRKTLKRTIRRFARDVFELPSGLLDILTAKFNNLKQSKFVWNFSL